MKAEFTFGLENAGWPALVVNDSGVIVRANTSAVNTFGLPGEGKTALLATIWSPSNATRAEVFLSQVERSSAYSVPLKFRVKEGTTETFQGYVCSLSRDGRKVYLFQFLKRGADSASTQSVPTPVQDASSQPPERSHPTLGPSGGVDLALAHKQKLDCALQLTRTVALDFNNALTSILGYTSLILSRTEPNHPWRGPLLEVEKSAEHAAEIAADLAAFSRQEKEAPSQTAGNLNDLMRRTVSVFQNPAHQHVVWGMQLESKLFSAVFDEAKMQQAFMKVLENAVQSLKAEGHIIVRSRNTEFKEPYQDGNVRLEPGSYVCMEFEDNGCGVSPENLPRIFEPFFTTKSRANHRGLGLAWVYGIITNHGGSVAVASEPGLGTCVRIYLPALGQVIRDENLDADNLTGAETILMVDDEDLLLTMGEAVLSAYGYRVLTANSGDKAIEVFTKSPERVDLVITDLVMPKMGGREVIERLRRISPDVRVICTSGFARALNPKEQAIYLQKPFTSQALLRKVRQILGSGGTTH